MSQWQQPLVAPLAALVLGIVLAREVAFEKWEAGAFLGVFAIAAILAIWKASRWLRIGTTLLLIGAIGMASAVWHARGPAPTLDAAAREAVIISGCVVEPPVFFEDREQFTLELAPGARARVTLSLDEGKPAPRLEYGQKLEIETRVRRPRNFENPGSFDRVSYLARREIFWTATAKPESVRVLPGECGSNFEAMVFGLRSAALERIDRMWPGDRWATGMMAATLIGESSRLERLWIEDFRRTGTYHALVISGLHVTVLAGVLLWLLRVCLMREVPALAITAAAAWVYALVAGFSAPVVRAAGAFTLFLAARYCFRRLRLLNLVAAVAIVFLLLDPEQLFESSFQLSFMSVATLAALAMPMIGSTSGPLTRGLRGIADSDRDLHLTPRVAQFRVELRLAAEAAALWTRLPGRWALEILATGSRLSMFVFELAAVSAVIQAGLALPMILYFHRISITGLSANPLIVPAMTAVVPLGFLAILTGWPWVAQAAGAFLKLAAEAARIHAGWEPSWRIPDPPFWLAAGFVISLVTLAVVISRVTWRRFTTAITGVFFLLIVWQPFSGEAKTGELELSAIDVGQGESLLVQFPDGQKMLVDAGGLPVFGRRSPPRLDIGEDVVSPYLWQRGIRRLDVVVATHAHRDHTGGIPSVIENFRPREVWTGANPPADLAFKAPGPVIKRFTAGERFLFGGSEIEILSPPADYTARAPGNNDSLAFRITHGRHTFLLTGDIEREMEDRLLGSGRLDRISVLKVAHHGSRTSTSALFLETTRPVFALISAGYENQFRHPNPGVLTRLADHHAMILRTDLHGLITVRSDGRRITADAARWPLR